MGFAETSQLLEDICL